MEILKDKLRNLIRVMICSVLLTLLLIRCTKETIVRPVRLGLPARLIYPSPKPKKRLSGLYFNKRESEALIRLILMLHNRIELLEGRIIENDRHAE